MKRFRRLLKSAFSLVEVVMALGVISFAMVGMLGLLSVGFSAGKKASNDIRGATMSAQMISYLRNSTLSTYTTANMRSLTVSAYFDENGKLLVNSASGTLITPSSDELKKLYRQCQITTKSVSSALAPDGNYGVMTMTFSWPTQTVTISRRQQEVINATLPK